MSKREFPKYDKHNLDVEVWPTKYWDSSRLCPSCDTHWPDVLFFGVSPCCGIPTEVDPDNAPDMRWPDAVSAYQRKRFEDLYEEYNGGLTDQDLVYEDNKKKPDFDFEKAEIRDSLTH